jgi:hypothetical protein
VARCEDQTECREGFVCTGGLQGTRITLSAACYPKRSENLLQAGKSGAACSGDVDCGGGICAAKSPMKVEYPGNYCTGRCYEDASCGAGGVCLWPRISIDPGYCLRGCQTDADCGREGYGCWDLGDGEKVIRGCYPRETAFPDNTVGRACEQDAQCSGVPGSCMTELPWDGLTSNELIPAPGGYCSQRCWLDSECGVGAQCVNYGTRGGLCLASCSNAQACRAGYRCYAHHRDHDPNASVCIPDPASDADAGI